MELVLKTSSMRDVSFPTVSLHVNFTDDEVTQLRKHYTYSPTHRAIDACNITTRDIIMSFPMSDAKRNKCIDEIGEPYIGYSIDINNIFLQCRNEFIKNNIKWNVNVSNKLTKILSNLVGERMSYNFSNRKKFSTSISSLIPKLPSTDINFEEIDSTAMELRIGDRFYNLNEVDKSKKFTSALSSLKSETKERVRLFKSSYQKAISVMERNHLDEMYDLQDKYANILPIPEYSESFYREYKITIIKDSNYIYLYKPVNFSIASILCSNKKATLKKPIVFKGYVRLIFGFNRMTLQLNKVSMLYDNLNHMIAHPHVSTTDGRVCLGSLSTVLQVNDLNESTLREYVIPLIDSVINVLSVMNTDSMYQGGCDSNPDMDILLKELIKSACDSPKMYMIRDDCNLYAKATKRYWGKEQNDQ